MMNENKPLASELVSKKYLTKQDIHDFAIGANFLGSGGGGDTYITNLMVQQVIDDGGVIELISVSELDDDTFIAPCSWVGAPAICSEKMPSGNEATVGLKMLEKVQGKKVDAIIANEIGGSNGLAPLLLAASENIPIVDGDGMGRAFPESQMTTFNLHGVPASPIIISDEKGNCLLMDAVNPHEAERIGRSITIEMGGTCHMFDYSCSGYDIKQCAVRGTVSLGINIGKSIREAKENGQDPFDALFAYLRATGYYNHAGILFDGRIIDVLRETRNGFSVGKVIIESYSDNNNRVEVEYQNENLKATINGRLVGITPDIITVMDRETAEAITTEKLKYGQRVKLVGASVPPILRTPKAISLFGPKAFGFEEEFMPIEELNQWK